MEGLTWKVVFGAIASCALVHLGFGFFGLEELLHGWSDGLREFFGFESLPAHDHGSHVAEFNSSSGYETSTISADNGVDLHADHDHSTSYVDPNGDLQMADNASDDFNGISGGEAVDHSGHDHNKGYRIDEDGEKVMSFGQNFLSKGATPAVPQL